MSEVVYFFDDNQKLIETVFEESLTQCFQEREISEEKTDLLKDVLTVQTPYSESLKSAAYMAVQEFDTLKVDNEEKIFTVYRILKISEPDNSLLFTGINFGADELDGTIVKDIRPTNESIKSVATRLITGTEWRIGHVDSGLGTVSGSFYYISVKEALKQLQTFDCEIVFKCKLNGDGISDKWIEIYKQIGVVSNERFTYGDQAYSVVREQDRSGVFTSLIGRGRGEEVGDGFGRRLEFADVEWKKSKGDPLDKPKGQNWLEMPEATKLLGIPNKNGTMRKREQVVIFEDIEDPKELLLATYKQLLHTSRQLVQFKTSVYGGDSIGNTVTVHRYDRDYHYQTRVFKTQLDRLSGKCQADLGDQINKGVAQKAASTEKGLAILDKSKMTFYESTEIGKYQDDIMRGAGSNGGSVYQVNGIEAGISDSREVYETVYMDGPSIVQSQYFMIQNNSGISFKACKKGEWQTIIDVHNGASNTAWTLDGVFNANYIKAGIINGVQIQAENDNFLIDLFNGRIRFYDNTNPNSRITLGTLQATRGATYNINGTAIVQEPKYIFSLNSGRGSGDGRSSPVFQIPADSTSQNRKWRLNGTGVVTGDVAFNGDVIFEKNVDVKGKLTIKGEQVYPGQGGQGGGGWNGNYPSEISTQAEKYAWQLWITLLQLGYSKAAAAGILGNVQGEVGNSMNPDTAQVNGPAYGCVQWDGSAYPLIGSPTWNGREYVQRLIAAAKINESYVTMIAQGKLIDWSVYNGQWIGAVSPTTVSGFKAITDSAQAAHAFELNFERPAAAHPERQGYAVNWYNKFKDLQQPGGTGQYRKPLDEPIIVTSEYGWRDSPTGGGQELHNAIDLVNNNNSAPIYASDGGKVVFSASGWNFGYGEYIIIQHKSDLFTGYAHNSQRFVNVGDTVTKGQKIAIIGATGNVTGIHTHFQFIEGTDMWSGHVNPRKYITF